MDSVMMDPEADQVKISIWPGVSRRIWLEVPKSEVAVSSGGAHEDTG